MGGQAVRHRAGDWRDAMSGGGAGTVVIPSESEESLPSLWRASTGRPEGVGIATAIPGHRF
jgi:hypothetical protein